MQIKRDVYLSKLKSKKENGFIKVITGIRRCGKSFLLFNLYHEYLNSIGVENSQIIEIALDEVRNAKYRNPIELDKYIRSLIVNCSSLTNIAFNGTKEQWTAIEKDDNWNEYRRLHNPLHERRYSQKLSRRKQKKQNN